MGLGRWMALVGMATLSLSPGAARAQCPPSAVGCDVADPIPWSYRDAAFADVMWDSGWVPSSGPIQLRFTFTFGGSTEVEMTGDPLTHWPAPLSTAVLGEPGTGRFAINYGLELEVQLRFDVTIAGVRYHWTGDIPVPGIPEDLRMAAEGTFDPFLLPPSDRPVVLADTTDRVQVLRYDALSGFIPIPGVGGGIALTLQGSLQATYETVRIVMNDATDIVEEGLATIVHPDPGETNFGAAKDLLVHPEGVIAYDGELILSPELYLSFVGTRRDYPLFAIPVPLVVTEANVIFDDAPVHVPLPDIQLAPRVLPFGEIPLGEVETSVVDVSNAGELALELTVDDPAPPFYLDTTSLTVPPGGTASFVLGYWPADARADATVVLVHTNDPDEPTIALRLSGSGLAPAVADAGVAEDAGVVADASMGAAVPEGGGCGCRASGTRRARGLAILVLALSLLTLSRARPRRRGSARAPRG